MIESLHGAYGFRLQCRHWGGALRDLVELDAGAPLVTLTCRAACPSVTFDLSDDGHAAMGARGATAFYVWRDPASIVIDSSEDPAPDALVHPIATVPLAILARWRGDVTLHAGAFAAGGSAWALIGEREAGKSTALGQLSQLGHPVVADDLVVVRDGFVWAGPHCVDLRPDAAERLGPTRDLGFAGLRRRFRLSSAASPARLPLAGFFLLEWHDHPHVFIERLSLGDRVRILYGLEYAALVGPADPSDILELASLPAWRVSRPADWSASEEAVGRMLGLATASAAQRATRSGAR